MKCHNYKCMSSQMIKNLHHERNTGGFYLHLTASSETDQMAEEVLTKSVQIWKNLLCGFIGLNFALKHFSTTILLLELRMFNI